MGSLFSGIGGLDLGLERAGMRIAWQVEIDSYARKVLKKHWPKTPLYSDVREVHGVGADGSACPRCLPPVDVLAGGSPCQDISNAGKRAGIGGSRSSLWGEYARLIREIRPAWVIIENVPALRTRGLGRVLGDLSASGYDAEWDGISAAHLGAPHRRDRIWIVAYPKREPVRVQPGRGGRTGGEDPLVFGLDGESGDVADSDNSRLEERVFKPPRQEREAAQRSCLSAAPWPPESGFLRVAHGVPSRVDRLKCLGNAVVPQVAQFIGERVSRAADQERTP